VKIAKKMCSTLNWLSTSELVLKRIETEGVGKVKTGDHLENLVSPEQKKW